IAAITVALYIVAATILAPLMRRLPDPSRSEVYTVYYSDGYGVLRDVLQLASDEGYDVALSETTRQSTAEGPVVGAVMRFTRGKQRPAEPLFRRLSELEGVLEIKAEDQDLDEVVLPVTSFCTVHNPLEPKENGTRVSVGLRHPASLN